MAQSVYRSAAVPASAGHAAQPAVTFTANSDAPKLPKSIASYVEAVVGLDTYPVKASNAVHVPVAKPGKAAKAARPRVMQTLKTATDEREQLLLGWCLRELE